MNGKELETLVSEGLLDRVICREQVTSTNDVAKELVREGFNGTALIISEIQTAGRGRMGRHWESPAGTGIWMSLVYRAAGTVEKLSSVTLLSALAIAEAVNQKDPGTEARIKWPNDVILNRRKVSGILTEMISDGKSNYIIPGIGINVNTESFPPELAEKATSLYLATGRKWERESLAVSIVRRLVIYTWEFEKIGELGFVQKSYNHLLINRDQKVNLTTENISFPDNPYTVRGIDQNGCLLVEDRTGHIHSISTGEVSVRGLLGYV